MRISPISLAAFAAFAARYGLQMPDGTTIPQGHPVHRRALKLRAARERCAAVRQGRRGGKTDADLQALNAAALKRQRKGQKLYRDAMQGSMEWGAE